MRSKRRANAAAIAASAGILAIAGCSSSSSSGAKAAASASAKASAFASKFGINPNATAPGAGGPAGDISAPASQAPNPTNPGGSEVFPNVSAAQHKQMGNHLVALAGVRTVTYYPQFKQLQIYFTATATTADRQRVYRYVTRHDPAAAGTSASPGATTSPSPTPSAS